MRPAVGRRRCATRKSRETVIHSPSIKSRTTSRPFSTVSTNFSAGWQSSLLQQGMPTRVFEQPIVHSPIVDVGVHAACHRRAAVQASDAQSEHGDPYHAPALQLESGRHRGAHRRTRRPNWRSSAAVRAWARRQRRLPSAWRCACDRCGWALSRGRRLGRSRRAEPRRAPSPQGSRRRPSLQISTAEASLRPPGCIWIAISVSCIRTAKCGPNLDPSRGRAGSRGRDRPPRGRFRSAPRRAASCATGCGRC